MKKRLLSLLGAAFVALGINAQWVEPEAPTTGSEVISGHQYRIKNVGASEANETGMFLSGGSSWYSWATSTVLVDEDVNPLTFTVTETESGWTLQRTSDNKYTFVSGQFADSKPYYGWGEMHVDQGSQAADLHFFNIVKNEKNGYYRIQTAPANSQYIADTYWGWELGDEPNVANAVYGTVSDEEKFAMDWEFIDYSVYNARVELYNALESSTDYSNVDISAASKVYNDPASSLETIQQTTEDLKAAIKAALTQKVLEGATVDDPRNGTELIENNDFSAGNIKGWTCTFVSGTTAQNIGYQKASYTGLEWTDEETGESGTATISQFIEAWSNNVDKYKFEGRSFATIGDGKLYQTIYGLPAGKYKLSADVNAVQQYETSANPVTGVQLYVIGGEIDSHMDMATDNKVPEHFILTFIHSGGDVELGLRTQSTTANWIGADNFKLMYYGEITENPYKVILDDAIAAYEKQYAEDYKAEKSIAEAYEKALAAAQSTTGGDQDYIDAKTALDAAAADLKASIAAYNELATQIEKANGIVNEYAEGEWADLSGSLADLKAEWETAYDEGSYDAEKIASIAGELESFVSNFVSENMKPGNDVTLLLKNAAFTSGFSGWTITGATPDWQLNYGNGENANAELCNEAPAANDGLAEKWHAVFSMSQVIKNMPKGLYTLSVQGFNRKDGEGNPAELYAMLPDSTEQTVPFADIHKYATETQLYDNSATEAESNWWRSDKENDEGLWIPNSMTGSAWHFMNKKDGENYDYTNKFNILMKEAGDLTVGARCDNTLQWVIFDNFRIVYQGAGAGVYQEPIEELIASAESYKESVTNPMADEIDEVIKAAEDALEVATEEACEAAILALNEVIAKAGANIQLKKEITTYLYDTYQVEYDEKSDYLVGDYAQYAEKAEKINDYVENEDALMEMSSEELTTLKADAEKMIETMNEAVAAAEAEDKLAEIRKTVADATDDDPVDLTEYLVNPDLATGDATGWTLNKISASNCQYQKASYSNEDSGVSIEGFLESWRSTADSVCVQADIYQQIMLPAGTYQLSADMIASHQADPEVEAYGVYLYAGDNKLSVATANGKPQNFSVVFKLTEEKNILKVGFCSVEGGNANWIAADNFTLEAYGANSSKETAIEAVELNAQKAIYTLTGVRVQKAAKPGLYIINGKKIVVK